MREDRWLFAITETGETEADRVVEVHIVENFGRAYVSGGDEREVKVSCGKTVKAKLRARAHGDLCKECQKALVNIFERKIGA